MKRLLAVIILTFVVLGCEADDTSIPDKCTPGSNQPCYCSGGKLSGVQSCNVAGTGWTKCVGCQDYADYEINLSKDGGVPDSMALDNMIPDSMAPDSITPDTLSKCTPSQSGCINKKIVECNTTTGFLDVKKDCSKNDYGDVKFDCAICKSKPVCLPPSDMYSGSISKYMTYQYVHRYPDCSSSPGFILDARYYHKNGMKMFYHRVLTSNFVLIVSVRDVTPTFSDSFYSSASSDPLGFHKVEVRLGNCSNWKLGDNKVKPTNYGNFKLKLSGLGVGNKYTISAEGMLYCSGAWKSFKYEAEGFIKSN